MHHFQGGSVYWSPATGAHEVHGAIRDRWAELGWENSALGFPTSDEYGIDGGRRSDFQNGSITWTPSGGAVVHQARDLEQGQVLGNGRLRHAGEVGQGANGLFALAHELFVDGPARRVGQGAEHLVASGRHGAIRCAAPDAAGRRTAARTDTTR